MLVIIIKNVLFVKTANMQNRNRHKVDKIYGTSVSYTNVFSNKLTID